MSTSELRHAREQLGLSLRDIADRTRIRIAILEAIENNDPARLPPAIFTRGFVKAYAREVGLDPQATAAQYAAALERAGVADGAAPRDEVVDDHARDHDFSDRETSSLATAALIVAAGLLFILIGPWTPSSTPSTESTAATPAATAGVGVQDPVATTGETRPGIRSAARPPIMRIDLEPQGPCWIEAIADGERVIYKLLGAGDRYAIEGYEDLVLKVGNPAALAFTISGAQGRPLGPAGQPTTVHITRANSQSFANSIPNS